jgi:iron complex outermembrane receptor protein
VLSDHSSDTLGVFAQSETALRDNLLLTAGVRYDRYSGDLGSTLNPRLALIYSPSDTGTLKAIYGSAFRAPNPYERYYNTEQPNRPPLHPETIDTYELAYDKQLGDRYRLTVSGYYYRVEHLVSQAATPNDDLYFDNLDDAQAKGIEVEIDRTLESGVSVRASYALQKAVDGQTDEDLSSSPRHMAKLSLGVPFDDDRMSAGLQLQYHGSAVTLLGNRADDFVVANFSVFRRPTDKGLELSGTIYNLFDTSYGYPGAEDHLQDVIALDGRTFLGKLTYRF